MLRSGSVIKKTARNKASKGIFVFVAQRRQKLAGSQCVSKGGQIELAGLNAYFGKSARTISILPKI